MSRSARGRKARSRCLFESLEVRRHLSADPGAARGLDDTAPPVSPGPAGQDGPTAELVPSTRTEGGDDSFVFRVIYRDANAAVRVDSLDDQDIRITGPDGEVRRAVFINVDDAVDGPTRVARYKFAPPGGSWDASDNGAYKIVLQRDEVFDTLGASAPAGEFGQLQVELPGFPESEPPIGLYGLDPAFFGAFPDDGIDDTAAIQAAIDALPRGPGVPIGSTPVGGIVLLRPGVYDTSYTIWLHSGVTLRGAGPQTVLRNRGTNIYQNVLALHSPFSHHFNVGVTVDRMTIYSVNGGGIGIDQAMDGDVQDLRLADLRMSTAGPAINLSAERVYYSEIDNVEIFDPGSTALRLGKDDGSNHVNRIRNLSVTGQARAAFRPELALVQINADVLVQGLTISTRGADVLPLHLTNRMTLNGLRLEVPTASCPGGVAVVFNKVAYALMDSLQGVGVGRRLLLIDSYNVDVGVMTSDGSSDLVSQLATVDATSHLRVRNAVGGRLITGGEQLNGGPGTDVLPPPTRIVDARIFGVVGSDAIDDTLQLQAAIDSLPAYNPATGTGGGIVQLPLGNVDASASIRLPSGVWLRGHGNGTTIQNWVTVGANRGVIELTGDAVEHRNVGAGIVELGLRGENCTAITTDGYVWNDVDHLLIQDVRLKGGSRGIDLRRVRVTNSLIDRVVMTDPASTALWLGRIDNSSYGNLVRGFRVMGRAPIDFVAETALFIYHGSNRVESGSIEDTFATVLPIYVAGPRASLIDVYLEYPQQPNSVGYVFDRVQDGYVSHLWHVDPQRKIHLTGNSTVRFGTVNILGYTTPLDTCIFVEGGSHATFDTVLTQFDAGLLDDPSVTVHGIYGLRARRYVDTDAAMSRNLVADPGMLDVADNRVANWEIYWGDTPGTVQGNWAVETAGGRKRLRLTVLSNPNNLRVSVRIKLNVPPSAIGREAVARWRVDGEGQVFAWRGTWDGEYQARVTNSLTAMASPKPVAANEMLWIDLRAAQGTYYISNVGVSLA